MFVKLINNNPPVFFKKNTGDKLRAAGIFIGMVVGAGFFSLPYVINRSGLIWGAIHFFIVFFVILIIHILYGFICFSVPGKHRFTGYVRLLLGKKAEKIALINTLFTYYGTFLIYSIFAGFFIFNLFPFFSSFYWSVIFLCACAASVFLKLKKTGEINFYLTIPIIFSIIFLAVSNFKYFDINNFYRLNIFFTKDWFFPYGVFVFSLSGFSVIPDMVDFFKKGDLKKEFNNFKKTIKISQFIISVFYIFFIITILGVLNGNIEENIFAGIKNVTGKSGFITLSFIGFLSVFTSMITLIADLKNIFIMDYKLTLKTSLFLIILPVLVLTYAIGQNLSFIISFIGAVGLGVFGLFIFIMNEIINKKQNFKNILNKPVYNIWFSRFALSLLVFAAFYEVFALILKT